MNLRDLEYVSAVAKHGSFSKAAQICNVSQPALSNQIRKLENELGMDLFIRASGETRLSGFGERIVAIADEMLGGAQRIKDAATEFRDPEALPFLIGMTPTLAPYLANYFSNLCNEVFPNMRVSMIEDLPQNMLKRVEDYTMDMALVAELNRSPTLDFTSVWSEPLFLGMRRGHPLETLTTISPEEVPTHDFIRLPHAFGYALEDRLPPPNPAARAAKRFDLTALRFETICRHICHSDDCTIVPALAAEQFQRDGWSMSFVPFEGPGHLRDLGAATRVNCPRQPLLAKIGAYIQRNPPKGVTPTFAA